jgi:mycothiol synthase
MRLILRTYKTEEDYWKMRAFLRSLLPLNHFRPRSWDVVRFDYWRWHIHENIDKRSLEESIYLWEKEDGQIVAALNVDGPDEAFMQVHPALDNHALEEEMLLVAEQRLSAETGDGKRRLNIYANQHDKRRQGLLTRHGYIKQDGAEHQRRRTLLDPIPEAPLPAGYTIRPVGLGAELIERCWASGLAFHPNEIKYAIENRDVRWYHNIQNAPLYRRDLDLNVVAPDGSVAAFCTVWFDDVNRVCVFEPVGTVPAHQRLGLGKAVMCEGLRRLKKLGAVWAFVGSYSERAHRLYESAGFTDYELDEPWEKVF